MLTRRLSPSLHRAIVGAALLALALAQTLGALHAIVHAPRLAAGTGQVFVLDRAPRLDGLAALFAGHGPSDHACDLYDQLSHGDALASALPVVPMLPPGAAPAADVVASQCAHETAGVFARGPPSSLSS